MELVDLNTVQQQKSKGEIEVGPNTDPREFLRAVYLDANLPLSVRMRAAIELMPYSYPKLAVVAQVTEQGFAELLDRRLKKLAAMEQNGSKAVAIEGPKPEIEIKPPMPRIADRRYRRM